MSTNDALVSCPSEKCCSGQQKLTVWRNLTERCVLCHRHWPLKRVYRCTECELVFHWRCGKKMMADRDGARVVVEVDGGGRDVPSMDNPANPQSTTNPMPWRFAMKNATKPTMAIITPNTKITALEYFKYAIEIRKEAETRRQEAAMMCAANVHTKRLLRDERGLAPVDLNEKKSNVAKANIYSTTVVRSSNA